MAGVAFSSGACRQSGGEAFSAKFGYDGKGSVVIQVELGGETQKVVDLPTLMAGLGAWVDRDVENLGGKKISA